MTIAVDFGRKATKQTNFKMTTIYLTCSYASEGADKDADVTQSKKRSCKKSDNPVVDYKLLIRCYMTTVLSNIW